MIAADFIPHQPVLAAVPQRAKLSAKNFVPNFDTALSFTTILADHLTGTR